MTGHDTRAKHERTSRVTTLANFAVQILGTHGTLVQSSAAEPQEVSLAHRAMKNLVTWSRFVTHASCLNTYEPVHEDPGHHAHGVAGSVNPHPRDIRALTRARAEASKRRGKGERMQGETS